MPQQSKTSTNDPEALLVFWEELIFGHHCKTKKKKKT